MPPLVEDTLTSLESRDYFTLDDAVTIAAGEVATIPTGWIEAEQAREWRRRGRGTATDAQVRADRGHEKEALVSKGAEITFAFRVKAGENPSEDLDINTGTILRWLHVYGDGTFVMDELLIKDVEETDAIGELPGWSGTASARKHPVRGKITTWPPVAP